VDELSWAGAWLYKATGESSYLTKASGFFDQACDNMYGQGFSWDSKCKSCLFDSMAQLPQRAWPS
jgi:hypothetical protein